MTTAKRIGWKYLYAMVCVSKNGPNAADPTNSYRTQLWTLRFRAAFLSLGFGMAWRAGRKWPWWFRTELGMWPIAHLTVEV